MPAPSETEGSASVSKPRMKVLWLSNVLQSDRPGDGSGVWLASIARKLLVTRDIELANIAFSPVREVTRCDSGSLRQWAVPNRFAAMANLLDGLPPRGTVDSLVAAVEEFAPDVVHVWGVENFWGLLTGRGIVKRRAILEMQGVREAIARVFFGDLSVREIASCTDAAEIVRGATLWHRRRSFTRWIPFEREVLAGHKVVIVQSPWLAAQVKAVAHNAAVFHEDFILRDEFVQAGRWSPARPRAVFCSASYSAPFKGLHVAIRALAHLARRVPDVELRIAGAQPSAGLRRDGYMAWVQREATRLGVADRVRWLGRLTADRIVDELRACAAMVVPTFVEGYCLALAEAMLVGVPIVVSHVGGTPSLASDEESALFVPPGDHVMFAAQLERVLRDPVLAQRLAARARERARARHQPNSIAHRRIETYHRIARGME